MRENDRKLIAAVVFVILMSACGGAREDAAPAADSAAMAAPAPAPAPAADSAAMAAPAPDDDSDSLPTRPTSSDTTKQPPSPL